MVQNVGRRTNHQRGTYRGLSLVKLERLCQGPPRHPSMYNDGAEPIDQSGGGHSHLRCYDDAVDKPHTTDATAFTRRFSRGRTMNVPTPLPETPWKFPDPEAADEAGVVGLGADLEPATVVHAYRSGIFPMPANDDGLIGWWSPPLRGILDPDDLKISRSLRRSCRRYNLSVNVAFERVIELCATVPREGGWISRPMIEAYTTLHQLGWAHSVEVWQDDELVGGLYGIQVGGLFAGESMFHLASDASKVALVGLVGGLHACGVELLDVQWKTDHLATLGVQEITRSVYLERLTTALRSTATSFGSHSGKELIENTALFLDRIR